MTSLFVLSGALTVETFPRPAAVVVDGERIRSVEPMPGDRLPPLAAAARAAGAVEADGGGGWLLPAWIDLQLNDIGWLSGGLRSPEEHLGRIGEVLRWQAARGVGGLLLTTMAAPVEEIEAYLRAIARVRAGGGGTGGIGGGPEAILLGGLVEGTFMNPALHGAHNPAHVLAPDPAIAARLAATGGLRAINIAPETSPAAIPLIRDLAGRGVAVACGHARPSGDLLREAVAAGLSYVIHLGNGPTGSSLKGFARGGLLEEALRDDRLSVTLILDGFHVAPAIVRDVIARKGIEGVAGISDAAFAAGAPPGEFEQHGVRGRRAPGGWLEVVPPDGSPPPDPREPPVLFGSAIGMREVFESALRWLSAEMEGVWMRRHPALPLPEAVGAASRIASANPARIIGEPLRGRLAPGARADLVLAEIRGDPGDYRVGVRKVWVGGESVSG